MQNLSHDGLALEMGQQWTAARFVALFGKWLFFTGSRWKRDETAAHDADAGLSARQG